MELHVIMSPTDLKNKKVKCINLFVVVEKM